MRLLALGLIGLAERPVDGQRLKQRGMAHGVDQVALARAQLAQNNDGAGAVAGRQRRQERLDLLHLAGTSDQWPAEQLAVLLFAVEQLIDTLLFGKALEGMLPHKVEIELALCSSCNLFID